MTTEVQDFEGLDCLINGFVKNKSELLSHHSNSFNYLIEEELPKIIQAKVNNTVTSEINQNFHIQYNNITLKKPYIIENFVTRKLYPNECRIRDITYSGSLEVDITIYHNDDDQGY